MRYKYELDDKEIEVFEQWQKEQVKKNNSNHSTIGGRFSFIFTTTGIGIMVESIDNETDEKKTLTNFDKW